MKVQYNITFESCFFNTFFVAISHRIFVQLGWPFLGSAKTLHYRRVEPQTTSSHHVARPSAAPPLLRRHCCFQSIILEPTCDLRTLHAGGGLRRQIGDGSQLRSQMPLADAYLVSAFEQHPVILCHLIASFGLFRLPASELFFQNDSQRRPT